MLFLVPLDIERVIGRKWWETVKKRKRKKKESIKGSKSI